MSVEETTYGTWRVRWRDDTGKQRAKSFKTEKPARQFERRVLGDLERGTYVPPVAAKLAVRDWADTWLDGARNLTVTGRDTYRRDLDRYVLPVLGDLSLRGLTDERIDEFLAAELDNGLAPSSVLRHYRTIHRMCQVAIEKRKLHVNPCGPVTPPRVDATEMRFLDVDQVEALASAIYKRYRAWVLLATYGGPRWSETVGLQRKRVDGARVTIADQLQRRRNGAWDRVEPKTKAGRRTITLPASVADELAAHLDEWSLGGAGGLVFPNQDGDPMNGPHFRGHVFKPALARAKLDPTVRIHDLRHTAVALAVAAGAHPKAIQVRMGHASIAVTLDRYGHLFPQADENVAQALDGLRSS